MTAVRRDSGASSREVVLYNPPPPGVLAIAAAASWRLVAYLCSLIVIPVSKTAALAADAIVPPSVRRLAEPSITYNAPAPALISYTDPWRPNSPVLDESRGGGGRRLEV